MTERFKLDGVVYEMGSQADVTLRDFILLEFETEALGKAFSMGDIVRLGEKFNGMSQTEARRDPEAHWMLAATLWMAMVRKARQSGDNSQVLFATAIDSDLDSYERLPDPKDRQPAKKAGKRPPASGQAAKRAAAKRS